MALNRQARLAVGELRDIYGITDLTPDEVATLHDLGKELDAACAGISASGLSSPVFVGNVRLFPLTCAGADWWSRVEPWTQNQTRTRKVLAFAYCLAHGREPDRLEQRNWGDVWRDVRAWSRTVGATVEELDAACSVVFSFAELVTRDDARAAAAELLDYCASCGWRSEDLERIDEALKRPPRDENASEAENYWRQNCERMVAVVGGTVDEWWRTSWDECVRIVNAAVALQRTASEVNIDPRVTEATRRLRAELVEVIKRREARKDGENGRQ